MSAQAAFAVDSNHSNPSCFRGQDFSSRCGDEDGTAGHTADNYSNSNSSFLDGRSGIRIRPEEQRYFEDQMSYHVASHIIDTNEAARRVARCLKKRQHHVVGRILRKLVNRSLSLDPETLESIMIAADSVFFDGKLGKRVEWKWSGEDERQYDPRYEHELLGTTAVRRKRCLHREAVEVETLIILSTPLLTSQRYTPDLLLSTFLHELVHCYLFICCGEEAWRDGGHSKGFRTIMKIINDWAGNPRLHLCSMKAHLDDFLIQPPRRGNITPRQVTGPRNFSFEVPPYVEREDYSPSHNYTKASNPIYIMNTFNDGDSPRSDSPSLSSGYFDAFDCPQVDGQ